MSRSSAQDRAGVLIVGAGPTGLVLALWLCRLGVRPRVIDRSSEPGTTSRAMGIQARTLEFYQQVGVADGVVRAGHEVAAVNLWGRGRRAMRLPIAQIGKGLSAFPYLLIYPQDQHERFLVEELRACGVEVERQTELVQFAQTDDGVEATLRRADGSHELCGATYLAGCDGARSTVRDGLGVGFPGATYEGHFYVADVEASGPSIDDDIHIDLDEGDFVGVFPYRHARRVRLIGAVRDRATDAARELTFDDVRGRAIEHMRLQIDRVHWFSTYRVHHRVVDHFRVRRVFLLGDAAHIHSPVGGQGMNTGIGDAVNLAWKLAAVLRAGARSSLLDTYEAERIGFARRLVQTTDRVFGLVTHEGAIAEFVRLQLVPRVAPWLVRIPAVRRFAFRTVSQIGIEYRDSQLSEGRAGRVHGGDRLPWAPLSGDDNFSALASLSWQAHVYGKPADDLQQACAEHGVQLYEFAWRPEMRRCGLTRDALYLVRPDGYIALAARRPRPERLHQYFADRAALFPSRPYASA